MDLGIAEKSALVTGGSRGVGRAIGMALAQEGVNVCLTARRPDLLEETANEIRHATGVRVLTVPADMSVYEDVRGMVKTAAEGLGGIDILVNNAASFTYGGALQLKDEDWLYHFNVKTFGYLRCMREVAPYMQRNHWGRIVNIAGSAARQSSLGGLTGPSAGATNAAIINISKSFSDALAADGITVNVIHPGASDSDRRQLQIEYLARELGISEEQAEQELERTLPPIGRRVVSADTAPMVLFFASQQAGVITGQTIAVDGGAGRGVFY